MAYECVCDYDGPDAYVKTDRKAVKRHQCYECARAIQPGETYEHVSALYDGLWSSNKTCPRCLALRDYVVAHIPCSCWMHGSMIEDVMHEAETWAHQAPGLLFGAYRRKVKINSGPLFVRG